MVLNVARRLGGKLVTQVPKDKTAEAEKARKLAAKKAKERKQRAEAAATENKGSINKNQTVSQADKDYAKALAKIEDMKKRMEAMDSGPRKKAYKLVYKNALAKFKKKYGAEKDSMVRKQQQTARDNKMKGNVTLPKAPFDLYKGGMAKKKNKKPSYNKGGYVNCGASNPGTQRK
jgi:hypothetical protein